MTRLRRGPNGAFIGDSEALTAWLPAMLNQCWIIPLSQMLKAAEKWCDHQAADQLRMASKALTGWDTPQQKYAEARIAEAERCFARKSILETARVQLEAIR